MRFPFAIAKTITFDQPAQNITSEGYLLNQLEERLSSLDMTITRLSDAELLLEKTDFVRSFRKKDFLRDLKVKVTLDQSKIRISLKTQTTLIFLFGLLPYGLYFAPADKHIPFFLPLIISTMIWCAVFIPKSVVITDIKNDLEYYLKRLNGL